MAQHAGGIGKRALVVDDEDQVRRLVGCILRSRGFEVIESSDGRSALDFLLREPKAGCVDILVTDVIMPGVSGFDVAKALTSLCPESCVVIMSGHCDVEAINNEVLAKKWRFVPKPFLAQTLADAVDAVLG